MQTLFVYVAKVIIYSGIFFGYYHIALRNKRFHYYNRFYLLISVAISLLLPLLHIELWQLQSRNPQVVQLMNVMVTDAAEKDGDSGVLHLSPEMFALLSYCLVAFCMLLSFVAGLIRIFRFKKQYPVEQLGSVSFINTDLQQAPFSFFNNLFWKNSISLSDATGQQIFRHELTHIEQKHSWDKVFLRLAALLFWVNPFYWLMQEELSLIHEFIADEKAIETKDAEAFALMLLQSQYAKAIISPAQSFHYSPIKRRLLMLTTSQRTSFSYARRLLVLPLLAITVFLFAFTLKHGNENKTIWHVNAPFTLVVDAGHGGDNNGAIGINETNEKDINLAIAKKIQALASDYGITVKMTRTNDVTVSQQSRMDFIKSQQPDACVSIHMNATEEKETSKREIEAYITKNSSNSNYAQSRLLGSSLLQAVKNDFAADTTLMQRTQQGIYVVDQNPYPAVILECGYMNNAESVKQLTDNASIEQMARDILQGVAAYANAEKNSNTMVIDNSNNWIKHIDIDSTKKPVPLYLLDGTEISAEEVKVIVPNTIESVNVLTDKESVKEYGEKGKNGVVIIKLKTKGSQVQKNVSATETIAVRDAAAATKVDKMLILADGTEMSRQEVNAIPADNIESISILQDKEAVKQYGEKGENGVIVIATRNGRYNTSSNQLTTKEGGYETQYEGTYKSGNSDTITDPIQSLPVFPDGNDAWIKYLQQNIKADIPAKKKAPAGTYKVTVSFDVAEDGNISNAKADNDPGYGTAAEAVRVIQRGPKWIPAKENGQNIATRTKQTITFQVAESKL